MSESTTPSIPDEVEPITAKRWEHIFTNALPRVVTLNKISGVHSAVPRECIDSYPTIHDNPLAYTPVALQLLLRQGPVGLIKPTETGKYQVISGLTTWRMIAADQNYVVNFSRPKRFRSAPLKSNQTFYAWIYPADLSDQEIRALALSDIWLRVISSYPDNTVVIPTFARSHELLGKTLIRELTPELSSFTALAEFIKTPTKTAHRAKRNRVDSEMPQQINATEQVEEDSDDTAGTTP